MWMIKIPHILEIRILLGIIIWTIILFTSSFFFPSSSNFLVWLLIKKVICLLKIIDWKTCRLCTFSFAHSSPLNFPMTNLNQTSYGTPYFAATTLLQISLSCTSFVLTFHLACIHYLSLSSPSTCGIYVWSLSILLIPKDILIVLRAIEDVLHSLAVEHIMHRFLCTN
jgi:hypothetical protein